MATSTMTWARDHHSTRLFVLSLVCRKRSSRYCKKTYNIFRKKMRIQSLIHDIKLNIRADNSVPWLFGQLDSTIDECEVVVQ